MTLLMGTFACKAGGSPHCPFSKILVSKVVSKLKAPFLDLKPCSPGTIVEDHLQEGVESASMRLCFAIYSPLGDI